MRFDAVDDKARFLVEVARRIVAGHHGQVHLFDRSAGVAENCLDQDAAQATTSCGRPHIHAPQPTAMGHLVSGKAIPACNTRQIVALEGTKNVGLGQTVPNSFCCLQAFVLQAGAKGLGVTLQGLKPQILVDQRIRGFEAANLSHSATKGSCPSPFLKIFLAHGNQTFAPEAGVVTGMNDRDRQFHEPLHGAAVIGNIGFRQHVE
jgi:hypothetical protein